MNTFYRNVKVPVFGNVYLISTEKGLSHILVSKSEFAQFQLRHYVQEGDAESWAAKAEQELLDYFAGNRTNFEVPLDIMTGTPFQRQVWAVLSTIPYGEVWSYADVARAINNPKAVRAVGQANRANPIPVIVPCHRVIGKSGKLTGYAGKQIGLKEELLQLEGMNAQNGMLIRG
ncbi:methylated-DNA--[protein]-cysteine S-methyltransferase [Priestia abyssalis]|uniref:methylated-DNA--[protein]-cysteine S-methyltransferase n=1 Tax=Priestia abyssalis TaxID=1221450 RepID=UPI000995C8D9|nr:methylated-DNA--[protein]-cysteine S-methyltransferase [Priestia abyssalis]